MKRFKFLRVEDDMCILYDRVRDEENAVLFGEMDRYLEIECPKDTDSEES